MRDLNEIRTDRLLLRRWRDTDPTAFAALNADRRVTEYLPALLTREESDALGDGAGSSRPRHRQCSIGPLPDDGRYPVMSRGAGAWIHRVESRSPEEFLNFPSESDRPWWDSVDIAPSIPVREPDRKESSWKPFGHQA
jgi:hypothetical protein